MTTMDIFQRSALALLFAFGFLLLSDKCNAVTFDRNPENCKNALADVCYEFVEGSYGWEEARFSCEIQGGNLQNGMSTLVKLFLQSIMKDTNTTNLSWWVGEGIQENDEELYNGEAVDISHSCTYLQLNPLNLVKTADCDERRGFLCTHKIHSVSEELSHDTHSRVKRTIINIMDDVEEKLCNYEQVTGQPSKDNRDFIISELMEATNFLDETSPNHTVSRVLNSSTAVLTLSLERCDIDPLLLPKSLFEEVFEVIRAVSIKIGANTGAPFELAHPDGVLYQQSFDASALGGASLGSQTGEYAIIPSQEALSEFLPSNVKVIAQLTTFRTNPHPSNETINGNVASLVLNDAQSKNEIKVKDIAQPFEVYLYRHDPPVDNTTVTLDTNSKILTCFNVSDANATMFLNFEPSTNVTLKVRLNYGSAPNASFNGTQEILSLEKGYVFMVTPAMLEGLTGKWCVEVELFNTTGDTSLSVLVSTHVTKCVYWDRDIESWSTSGCEVGRKSTPQRTQCLCNHLTLFGSSFFVMPNRVDLSRTAELFATINENYVVLALLCTFYGFYLMVLMWACYADRKASSKRKITLLEDNHPGAQYNYMICVHTGSRKNAGTSANVTMKLIGTEAESDIHNLIDPAKPVFERGSVDVFLMASPYPLGELKNMRLQHDNSGGNPSWYINKVTIQDLQTKNVSVFFCNCWLSADRGDGMTKKTFNAAKTNEISSFKNIFTSRTSNGFRDEHIWVSVWDPPSRSPFTRAQRISCCMSLLLCSMAINIAFWNIPLDSSYPVIIALGPIRLTWQEIMIGIQSGLLMFPINILIITIFRSIKPRIVPKKEEDDMIVKPPPVSIPSILKETQEVITVVSQSPRNKICLSNALETSSDLCPALENVHEFIQLMQGETMSDSHWVYCSKFLLCALCHLMQCLEKVDPKNFPTTYEYQHLLSTTNLLVRKAEMVFTSHLAYCPPPPKVVKRTRTPKFTLPWWCVFIGWFLLLSVSAISTFFTLFYGLAYGKDKSIKWVISLGLSLFESIFILQPLKVVGLAVIFALLLKPAASMEDSEEVEQVLTEQQDKCRQYAGRDI